MIEVDKFKPKTVYVIYIAAKPRRLSTTWIVDCVPEMRDLPECLVSYDIEAAGDCVKLTMTEAFSWDVPDALLEGSRSGWPAILSSLKSLMETGKPLAIKMEPPRGMMDVIRELHVTKPWLKR